MTHHRFPLAQWAVLTLLAIGMIAVGILIQGCSSDEEDPVVTFQNNMMIYSKTTAGSWVPAPKNMQELLDSADAIVIGTVNSVSNTGILKSYNEADNVRIDDWIDTIEAETGTRPAIYPNYTDYLIDIEKVIMDDGKVSTGGTVVLRMLGTSDKQATADDKPALLRLPSDGDRRVFTLARNPDGSYGLYGWWSHFVIDGVKVTFSDDLRTPIHFTDRVKPEDFVKALEDAVAARSES